MPFNKPIRAYWKLFKQSDWNKYPVVATTQGADSIVEHILVDDPDFCDLDALTQHMEKETLKFIRDIEGFLSSHQTETHLE